MSRRRTVEDWRRAVFAAPPEHLSDGARVLLLYLADHMRADRTVSLPRHKMARDLNRSERRIGEKLREALGEAPNRVNQHRYLDRVVRGQKHVQAVYQGLFPEALSRTDGGPTEMRSQQDGNQPAENDENRPAENPPLSVNPGSQQDPRGSRLSKHDAGCTWHPWESCPSDCTNADHRDSA